MTRIIAFPQPVEPQPADPELLALVTDLLKRVQAGVTIGLGLVEHQLGGDVVIEAVGAASYHHLNSGTARLQHLLAGMRGENT